MIEKNEFKQFSILVRDINFIGSDSPTENVFIGLSIRSNMERNYDEDGECIGTNEHVIVKARDIITGAVLDYGPHVFTEFGDFICNYKGLKYILERKMYEGYSGIDLYKLNKSINQINRIIKYAKAFLEAGDLFIINIDRSYSYSDVEMTEEEKKSMTENLLRGIRELSEMDLLDTSDLAKYRGEE